MPIPNYDDWIKRSRAAFYPRSPALQAIDAVVEQYDQQRSAPAETQRRTLNLLLYTIKQWELTKSNPTASVRWKAVNQLKGEVNAELQRLAPPPVPPRPAWTLPAASARSGPPPPRPGVSTPGPQEDLTQYLREALTKHRMKVRALPSDDFELLKEELGGMQFAQMCAGIMLYMPNGVTNPQGCRTEAIRILAAMMGRDPEMASRLLGKRVEVIVVPKSIGMTKLPQFYSLDGVQFGDGRTWDDTRGVAMTTPTYEKYSLEEINRGKRIKPSDLKRGRLLLAITEENLTGSSSVAIGHCYAKGYSTTSHEFAHMIHEQGLTKAQFDAVKRAYDVRLQGVVVNGGQVTFRGAPHQFNVNPQKDSDVNRALDTEWVDGKRRKLSDDAPIDCYAATSEFEYFAQCANAWLGTNAGKDPYTSRDRHNGRQWLLDNEPRMMTDVLQSVFGGTEIKKANWIVAG